MATLKQVRARIEALGASLDDGMVLVFGFIVDAPKGRVWLANGAHTLAYYHRGWKAAELYSAVLRDLNDGIEDCPYSDCDICDEGVK
jgi:hypothetical protein